MADNSLVKDDNTNPLPLFILNDNVTQVIDGTAASAASAVIDANNFQTVRITAGADCHIVSGVTPTATTSKMRMWGGSTEYFVVAPGHKIAVLGAIINITTMGK